MQTTTYIVTCDGLSGMVKLEGDRYPTSHEVADALAPAMANLINSTARQMTKGFGLPSPAERATTSPQVVQAVQNAISTKGAHAYKVDTTCDSKFYQ